MSLSVIVMASSAPVWAWVWIAILAAVSWRGFSQRSRRIAGALVVALLVAASVAYAGQPVYWPSCEACQAQMGWFWCLFRWCF